ncbi:MAG: glyoxylate/hydroxypyruvate reductase A [Rhizobiales bacterium]|nr:glyoxylate/hydroxypyruvate reductase A [Hyphomicrobiales bacterium]
MAKALLVAVTGPTTEAWHKRFADYPSGRDLRFWPDRIGRVEEIGYAAAWKAPHGAFAGMPNIKALFNLGAGVDHLIADPQLPDAPVVRAIHPDLSMRMTEYVVLHVLRHHRRQPIYEAQQRERVWKGHDQPAASSVTVGVLGLGVIGREAAAVLQRIGFQVVGWSRTPRTMEGVEVFHGAEGLAPFLARTEILVCLLPHTPATEGILNLKLLRQLKRDGALGGAYLVNAGRGKLQVDADIIAALDEGAIQGATLDVFPTEPLPAESALWAHPKITVTPHNAGDLAPSELVKGVFVQIDALERGEPLRHLVDRARGY